MDLLCEIAKRDFEQVVLCRDPSVGLRSVIAIHDTTLGPALGGVRMRRYPSHAAAVADALRLAEAMTYKASLAGLNLGGGKSVVDAEPTPENKRRLLASHAQYIAGLGGRYIPGVDMGTTVDDLEYIARWVPVVCSQRGDPSYFTARGVIRSIEAAAAHAELADGLSGARVAVQGLGNVGHHVVELLVRAGAEVLVADTVAERVDAVRSRFGVRALKIDEILVADVDVVCPCAGGSVITSAVAGACRARVIAGAANNVLANLSVAAELAQRAIVHVPDFVANAGGLIAVEAEVRGDDTGLFERVDQIAETAATVLDRAAVTGRDAVGVAVDLATERIGAAQAARPYFGQPVVTTA